MKEDVAVFLQQMESWISSNPTASALAAAIIIVIIGTLIAFILKPDPQVKTELEQVQTKLNYQKEICSAQESRIAQLIGDCENYQRRVSESQQAYNGLLAQLTESQRDLENTRRELMRTSEGNKNWQDVGRIFDETNQIGAVSSLQARLSDTKTKLKKSEDLCRNYIDENNKLAKERDDLAALVYRWQQITHYSSPEAYASDVHKDIPPLHRSLPDGFKFRDDQKEEWYVAQDKNGKWYKFNKAPYLDLVAGMWDYSSDTRVEITDPPINYDESRPWNEQIYYHSPAVASEEETQISIKGNGNSIVFQEGKESLDPILAFKSDKVTNLKVVDPMDMGIFLDGVQKYMIIMTWKNAEYVIGHMTLVDKEWVCDLRGEDHALLLAEDLIYLAGWLIEHDDSKPSEPKPAFDITKKTISASTVGFCAVESDWIAKDADGVWFHFTSEPLKGVYAWTPRSGQYHMFSQDNCELLDKITNNLRWDFCCFEVVKDV